MKTSTVFEASNSYRGAVEMQIVIRDNTYRSFLYMIGLATTAAMLISITATFKAVVLPAIYVPPIDPIDIGFIDIPSEPRVVDRGIARNIEGMVIAKHLDTASSMERKLDNSDIKLQLSSFSLFNTDLGTGPNLGGSNSLQNEQSKSTSINNTSKPQLSEDPDMMDLAEVDPVVDLASLQSKVEYPEFLRRNGVSGQVLLSVLIGEQGQVVKIKTLSSSDELFTKAAMKAIMQVTVKPATTGSKPVSCWLTIPVSFKIR